MACVVLVPMIRSLSSKCPWILLEVEPISLGACNAVEIWRFFLDDVDHVKRLYDCTMVVCHVYNNKQDKVFTITCYDIKLEDA